MQVNQKPNQVRRAYERNDLVPDLTAEIRKSKALDWLLHHVEMVDPDGHELDRDHILGHTHDEEADETDHDDEESPPEPQENP
jgi:trigger factor